MTLLVLAIAAVLILVLVGGTVALVMAMVARTRRRTSHARPAPRRPMSGR